MTLATYSFRRDNLKLNMSFLLFQLSQDIGYVMYSAFGSFYIPSCIMVFVYIKIYYAARERARRNIHSKAKFTKRISRRFAKAKLPPAPESSSGSDPDAAPQQAQAATPARPIHTISGISHHKNGRVKKTTRFSADTKLCDGTEEEEEQKSLLGKSKIQN